MLALWPQEMPGRQGSIVWSTFGRYTASRVHSISLFYVLLVANLLIGYDNNHCSNIFTVQTLQVFILHLAMDCRFCCHSGI